MGETMWDQVARELVMSGCEIRIVAHYNYTKRNWSAEDEEPIDLWPTD